MITVNREIADSIPFCLLFVTHNLQLHYAWILVGIQIHESSKYSPKFNSNGHRLTIQTIHLPKLLCSEMAANRADKISLKSDVLLNQYSNKLEVSTCPKWGMRSPKFEAIPTTFESLIAGLKITNFFCVTKAGQISCSSFSLLHTLRCVFCTL